MSMEKRGGQEIPPQPENTEQNFNDQVWIKVTQEGEQIRDKYYKGLGVETPPLEKDAEGWTEMQLYEVANLFGGEMYNGSPHLLIETTFRTKAPGGEDSGAIKNFNDEVWVKVTPEGEQVRRKYFKGLGMGTPKIQRNKEGWTEMQLYEVFNLFG